MIIVFTGEGKGKSSAAIGLIIRALGWGKKVEAIFTFKGWWKSGEKKLLEKLAKDNGNLQLIYFPVTEWVSSPDSKTKEVASKAIKAVELAIGRKPFLVVADELITAYALKLIRIEKLKEVIKLAKKAKVHLVLTGRGWPKKLNTEADIVTEMKKVVHCYDKGRLAKKGLDW